MKNSPSPYVFENHSVRTVTTDGEIWFVAKDIVEALGYSAWKTHLINNVPEEWKGAKRIGTLGGNQRLLCLSEQGMYFFINRSDKPKALPFQKWVAGEVLPQIRKTGSYSIGQSIGEDGFNCLSSLIEGKTTMANASTDCMMTELCYSKANQSNKIKCSLIIKNRVLYASCRNFLRSF